MPTRKRTASSGLQWGKARSIKRLAAKINEGEGRLTKYDLKRYRDQGVNVVALRKALRDLGWFDTKLHGLGGMMTEAHYQAAVEPLTRNSRG